MSFKNWITGENKKQTRVIMPKGKITSSLDDHNITNFHVSMSPSGKNKKGRNNQHVDIEMQFTTLDPPESIMRLIDEYTNLVLPRITQEEKNNG